jgi:hypothetical protein
VDFHEDHMTTNECLVISMALYAIQNLHMRVSTCTSVRIIAMLCFAWHSDKVSAMIVTSGSQEVHVSEIKMIRRK